MKHEYSDDFLSIFQGSYNEAVRTGWTEICCNHILISLLRYRSGRARDYLTVLPDFDSEELIDLINRHIDKGSMTPEEDRDQLVHNGEVNVMLEYMDRDLRVPTDADRHYDSLNLLNAIHSTRFTYLNEYLRQLHIPDIAFTGLLEVFATNNGELGNSSTIKVRTNSSREESDNTGDEAEEARDGDMLERFGRDLVEIAERPETEPIVGFDNTIDHLIRILCRKRKNCPLLIGHAGIGKRAIIKGLAARISQRQVPEQLFDKHIWEIDLGAIVAGSKLRGEFEERLMELIREVESKPEVIVFFDQISQMIGAGAAPGTIDAAAIMRPALSRSTFQCIGTATPEAYRHLESDSAFESNFQKVQVDAPGFDHCLSILKAIKNRYEKYHRVKYSVEALKACISLSVRYIPDRELPDKAIDVMDEAGALESLRQNWELRRDDYDRLNEIRQAKIREADRDNLNEAARLYEEEQKLMKELRGNSKAKVTIESVAKVISSATGIPASRIEMAESNKLLQMHDILSKRIVGQDVAIDRVVKAIRRGRAGIKSPDKPIGSFLFLGPTGVGKTLLAKALAEFMFDSDDALIRIDMSEYMEKFSSSRLIGAPPGYVGYDQGGELSEQVRRKPYSVVLLDEIEKASPEIFNLFLQVLDEGRLTDSRGKRIDFRNTVLIMTSNVGSRELDEFGRGIGFGSDTPDPEKAQKILEKAMGKTFKPEFINRLDEIVYFNSLGEKDIELIVDIEVASLTERLKALGHKLSLDASARKFLCRKGYDRRYGARPLKRAIQKYVEDPIAAHIISGTKASGPIKLSAAHNGEGLVIL